jgi:phospholipid transport system transporter-binding protein
MIEREGNLIHVSGALTMETVAALRDLDVSVDETSALVIDLAKVETVDSAAVGLLLAWLRQAQERGVTLSYTNLPANLTSLAQMYGVAELLPV